MTAVAESVPATGRGTPARIEVRSLTGLRILAALWVVLFHWQFTPPPEYGGVKKALEPIINSGYLGVDLFYVISGFVITLTYVDSMGRRPQLATWGRFWWARVCRVWPAYAVATVLFGIWLLWRRSVEPPGFPVAYQAVQPDYGVWSWVKQLLLVQLWPARIFDGTSFIGAAWSVSAEWAAYAVFPVLVLVLHRLRKLPWPVLVLGSMALLLPSALRNFETGDIYWSYSWLERIMTCFGAGALVCLAVRKLWENDTARRWAVPVSWVLSIEIVLVLLWAHSGPYDRYGTVTLLFPLLLGSLALADSGPSAFLGRPTMVLGGRVSYSLYLVHVPLFEIFWTFQQQFPQIGPKGAYTDWFVPNLPLIAIAVGYLLWRFVEEPARRRMRGLPDRIGAWRAERASRSLQESSTPEARG